MEKDVKTLDVLTEIEGLVRSRLSLPEIVASLRQLKASGLERAEAMQALESLREQAPDEAAEDRILEVMDFVSGFCSPHMTIWD